jgi:tetratricopeptide (TPR) repeat protein
MRGAVALAVAIISVQAAGCAISQRARSERQHAANLEPAALQPTPTEGGTVGTARVRFYIDDEYRAQNPDHEAKIRLQLERASHVLEPTVGLRLQAVEFRPWHRRARDNRDLRSVLEELEAMDPGQDVDVVIGMTDALSQVTTNLHELGFARVLGRHLVLRGLNDSAEVAGMESTFRTIGAKARQGLYSRRKRHKEVLILLHELAHWLGGLHVTGVSDILNPSYSHTLGDFGRANAELMRAVAKAKLARGPGAAEREWKSVLALVRERPSPSWNEDEKAGLLADLEMRSQGAVEDDQGEALGNGIRAADRDRFRAAERLYKAGRELDAWEELEPLLDFYPDEPGVTRLACRLAVGAKRDRAAIEASCARAAQVAPGDAEPQLRLAQSYLAAKEEAKSLAAARKALEILERGGPTADRIPGELATHFQALRAVTWAERAAAKAKDGKAITEWARTTRVRFGLSPGGPVPPEREAEYLAGLTELLGEVYARRFNEADRRAAALQRAFPRAPGLLATRCDLEVRRARYAAARTYCRDALRRYQDSAWAHYLLGLLDKRDKKPAVAVDHLERAISLDPELKHAYQVAAEIYSELGRADDRKRVNEAYKARFGHDL